MTGLRIEETTFGIVDSPEIGALIGDHRQEFDWLFGDLILNLERYGAAYERGQLVILEIRIGGGLVGYWVGMKGEDPNHVKPDGSRPRLLIGAVFHVDPQHRARVGRALVSSIEGWAKDHGIDAILLPVRENQGEKHRSGGFLRACGYAPSEVIYSKRLNYA